MEEKNSEKKERKMRDSGIPWIGEMPEGWGMSPLKYNYNIIAGATPDSTKQNFWDGNIKWITPADYKTKDVYVSFGKRNLTSAGYKACSTHMLPKGSIVISKRAPIGSVAITTSDLCTNQGCLGLVAKNKFVNNKYFYYVLSIYDDVLNLYGSGTTFKEISANVFSNIEFPLPSVTIQNSIADFLDSKCSEIDTLIENLCARVESVKEYKKAIITEAVTKGLDKNTKMKDSGVEWIGEIPDGWEIVPAKYLFSNSDKRKSLNDEQLTSSQKYGIITQKEYMQRENAKIVMATQGIEKWKHVEPNDFIISLRSFQGGLEMSEITGCITWHYVVLKPVKEIIPRYYKWFFKSDVYIKALQNTCNFIRDGQDLRYSNFVQVPLIDIPLKEQYKIADYLDSKCSEIDALLQNYEDQIATLEEYKKSIIYEYVTGKKEVC